MKRQPEKFIFLDRDGVLIRDFGYNHKKSQLLPLKSTLNFLKVAKTFGYKFVIFSNQSGVGKGLFSNDDLIVFNNEFVSYFRSEGICFFNIYYCVHSDEDNCNCRKPKIGMFHSFLLEYDGDIDLRNSWMIGDKVSDIEFGRECNIKNLILLKSSYHHEIDSDSLLVMVELNPEIIINYESSI